MTESRKNRLAHNAGNPCFHVLGLSRVTNDAVARVAYVGPFSYPDDSASARRVRGVALALSGSGYEVLVGSRDSAGQREPRQMATQDPFHVYHLGEYLPREHSRFLRFARQLIWGGRTAAWVDSLSPRPAVVMLYGSQSPYAARLIPWCRRHGVVFVADATEWYQPSHVSGGRLGPLRWNVDVAMRHYFVRGRNVIAISRFLEDFYARRGCHVVRIPPSLDTRDVSWRAGQGGLDGRLTLAYTGVPGKKDLLNPLLEALLSLDPEGARLKLELAGPTREDIARYPAIRDGVGGRLPPGLKVHGQVSHETALEIVRSADFSVLIRKPLRYAQAGFPTKVVESLAVGTPVICNLTSDLSEYVRDGCEGLIVADATPHAIRKTLMRALDLTPDDRMRMRRLARQQAEASFDFRQHVEPLRRFLAEARHP